jgi:hypothetical protein
MSVVVDDAAAGRAEMEKANTPARLVLVLLDAVDRKKEDNILLTTGVSECNDDDSATVRLDRWEATLGEVVMFRLKMLRQHREECKDS